MKYEKVINALKGCGYIVSFFDNKKQATDYIFEEVKGLTVGFGDSATLSSMKLAESLSEHNEVIDPGQCSEESFIDTGKKALLTDVFFTSANGLAETGELVNIDGTGNRIAGSLFGHKKVYFVVGTNKIESSLDKAIYRARNIAAPQNAKRLGCKTPCAIKGDRCYDCSSPDRICNAMTIYFKKLQDVEAEVIIIDETLGL